MLTHLLAFDVQRVDLCSKSLDLVLHVPIMKFLLDPASLSRHSISDLLDQSFADALAHVLDV